MTANELADLKEFEKMLSIGYLPAVKQAIEMLCQQQAEIEALKAKDLKKSMAIRSLNIQLKKALQYETFNR